MLILGFMDFKEVRRIYWTFHCINSDPIALRQVVGDCACLGIEPPSGMVSNQCPLNGYIDYQNNNLGISMRRVTFDTSLTPLTLELKSVKLRDHFVDPLEVHVTSERFDDACAAAKVDLCFGACHAFHAAEWWVLAGAHTPHHALQRLVAAREAVLGRES